MIQSLRTLTFLILMTALPAPPLPAQAIQSRGAKTNPGEQEIYRRASLPIPSLTPAALGQVSLLPGLFHDRRELAKAYVLRLKTEDLLQNHLLEAGVRIEKPFEQMNQGWESPWCQLRGHFVGHWLSAAAHFAATDRDPAMSVRVDEVVRGLQRVQQLNHGQWVGSIPEKYFAILAEEKEPIWSPQYTVHKTMMGLFDAYAYGDNRDALIVDEHAADWFLNWTDNLLRQGHGEVAYAGESGGMLELWANLYGATQDDRYLKLAARYAMPDLFRELLAGRDPLTNDHANASIPWIQGAARLYEVTGDPRYREVVEHFWHEAVEARGMFATSGANAGEFWIPPGQFGRFLGKRTQEHCTVYNMIRVAQYLFRWTGEARYADYIERALYNGILAQQNPNTGMVSYFLPLQPGAKKVWGSETHDFWCCDGTMVQAQAMFEDLIYYRSSDGITVSQFIPSQASVTVGGAPVQVVQKTVTSAEVSNFTRAGDSARVAYELSVTANKPATWTLRIRQPFWAIGPGKITIDGTEVAVPVSKSGFLEIPREWTSARVVVSFEKRITREPLSGDGNRFAFMDGPVVLAAVTDREPEVSRDATLTPQYEHQYVDGRDWQTDHYWVRTRQGTVAVEPVYEIADENYCVYFADSP